MISHFVQDFDPTCKRCEYARVLPAPKESLLHIFWDCPYIQEILIEVKRLISNEPITNDYLREILFLGSVSNLKYGIIFIFQTRNKNSMYSISKLYDFLKYHMNNMLSFLI